MDIREQQEQYVSVEEMARMLSLSKNKAYNVLASGEIEAVRLGKSVRVNKASLDAYLRQHPYAKREE